MNRDCPDVSFKQVKPHKMYEAVVEQIEGMINRGEMKPGDALPSERGLTSRLGVSRGVLSQAFRVLEEDGIIEVRPGSGRVVRTVPLESAENTQVVRLLERAAILDLIEVRDALERKIVELACERTTEAEIDRVDQVLQRCGNTLDVGLDEEFHLAVADATHNVVFSNMLRLNLSLLRKTRERTLKRPRNKQAMLTEHRAIYEAIARRDKQAAVQAVVNHLDGIKARLALEVDKTENPATTL